MKWLNNPVSMITTECVVDCAFRDCSDLCSNFNPCPSRCDNKRCDDKTCLILWG